MARALKMFLVATVVASGIVAVQAMPASAGCLGFRKIYYNSPGSDGGSNSSLNAEWIRVKNYCSYSRDLTDWTIEDVAGHSYTFSSFTLAGGSAVTVHTGSSTDTAAHVYWNNGWYIWNNTGDTAYLYIAAGTLKDKCAY